MNVRCGLCGTLLRTSPNSTSAIIRHMNEIHKKDKINEFTCLHDTPPCCYKPPDCKPGNRCPPLGSKQCKDQQLIRCPFCGNDSTPRIRKREVRKNKYFDNWSILNCWPLCFLPLFFGYGYNYDLYCTKCHCCIGSYDSSTKKFEQHT